MEAPVDHEEIQLLQKIESLYAQLGELRYGSVTGEVRPAISPEVRTGRVLIVLPELPLAHDGEKPYLSTGSPFSFSSLLDTSTVEEIGDVHWIGMNRLPPIESGKIADQNEEHKTASSYGFTTVAVDESMCEDYGRCCHKMLWPVFHSSAPPAELWLEEKYPEDDDSSHYNEEKLWNSYIGINQQFADVVRDVYKEGDIIWIHTYKLLLLPSMLRLLLPDAAIGFFLHIPFPSTEFYRMLTYREDMLKGMLGSTFIAFQTYNYARHFFSACSRIMGLESNPRGVDFYGHFTHVGILPTGIDPHKFHGMCKAKTVQRRLSELQTEFKGKIVFLGVSSVLAHEGLIQKFLAFEELLNQRPELANRVVLIQICNLSYRSETGLLARLHQLVVRINSKHANIIGKPSGPLYLITRRKYGRKKGSETRTDDTVSDSIVYLDIDRSLDKILPLANSDSFLQSGPNSVMIYSGSGNSPIATTSARTFAETQTPSSLKADSDMELCALLSFADVYISCSIRAGMNITPFQYAACRSAVGGTATLILSEFAGVAHSLGGGALLANPWDTDGLAKQFIQAISLGFEERRQLHININSYVNTHTAARWMRKLVTRLKSAQKELSQQAYLRLIEANEVKTAFEATKSRLLIFDYESVLVAPQSLGDLAAPDLKILALLEALCKDEFNIVVIVSCRPRHVLEEWFVRVKGLVLAAECGAFVRWPGEPDWRPTIVPSFPRTSSFFSSQDQYPSVDPIELQSESSESEVNSLDWHSVILPLFEYYRERTPGSIVEVGETNVAWYYHDADEEHGLWQANNILVSLHDFCSRLPIVILSETKAVRVRIPEVSKAQMLMHILRHLSETKRDPDLILTMSCGEDKSDDDMFTLLEPKDASTRLKNKIVKKQKEKKPHGNKAVTSVGEKKQRQIINEVKETPLPVALPRYLFTCLVGVRMTTARGYVPSIAEAVDLLVKVANCDVHENGEKLSEK